MDPDVDIMYFVPNGELYSKDQVRVQLSDQYNTTALPDTHRNQADTIWAERIAANPKLWNGTKFRLASVEQDYNSNGVIFNLGITSYKEFLGTNWAPNAKDLRGLGERLHGNSQQYLSDALGVGALLHTADDQMVLLKRSQHCGEAVGLWDIPGGHPEPKVLVGKVDVSQINLEEMDAAQVVDEIFDSTMREVIDEVNIPRDTLSVPRLLGIARNTTSSGRPSSEYICRCSLTSSEIRQSYSRGDQAEADESTSITFISLTDISRLQTDPIWTQLAPSAKGCIILYQKHLTIKQS